MKGISKGSFWTAVIILAALIVTFYFFVLTMAGFLI